MVSPECFGVFVAVVVVHVRPNRGSWQATTTPRTTRRKCTTSATATAITRTTSTTASTAGGEKTPVHLRFVSAFAQSPCDVSSQGNSRDQYTYNPYGGYMDNNSSSNNSRNSSTSDAEGSRGVVDAVDVVKNAYRAFDRRGTGRISATVWTLYLSRYGTSLRSGTFFPQCCSCLSLFVSFRISNLQWLFDGTVFCCCSMLLNFRVSCLFHGVIFFVWLYCWCFFSTYLRIDPLCFRQNSPSVLAL